MWMSPLIWCLPPPICTCSHFDGKCKQQLNSLVWWLIERQGKYRSTGCFFTVNNCIVFIGSVTLHVITESSVILLKYSSFPQAHKIELKTYFFTCSIQFCTHIKTIFYSTFDLDFICYHQIHIYNDVKHVLLFLIYLFLLLYQKFENLYLYVYTIVINNCLKVFVTNFIIYQCFRCFTVYAI